ncbi:nucleotidyltransferase domain-containing protein [Candidatus Woesearchaeota archaeon]|nr:nucleotidyltransferase domain-containing protein [Candidatus Woesearchaeota archaeon]
MLEIFNNLAPFIEDCYKRISVREYARIIKVSPPTASKILKNLKSEKLLNKELFRNHLFFWANKEDKIFIDLARLYWRQRLDKLKLYLIKNLANPAVILYGSLAKAENKVDSDIDLAIIAQKKELDLKVFEKDLKRKVQVFIFSSLKEIKNKELLNNILNGCLITGRLKL